MGDTCELKDYFRLHFNQLPIGIIILNLNDFRIIDFNTAVCQLLGYTRAEFSQIELIDLLAISTAEEIKEIIYRISSQERVSLDLVCHTGNGQLKQIKLLTQKIIVNDQPAWQCIFHEITRTEQIEGTLNFYESKYRTLFESVSDAIFVVDQETSRIMDVNNQTVALYGYSREELLCMSKTDIMTEPEVTRQNTRVDQIHSLLRYHRKKDGTVFPVELTANVITLQGRKTRITVVRDISERVKLLVSDARYRGLFETSCDGIGITDLEGRFLDCNHAFLDLLGYNSLTELQNKTFYDLTPPEYQEQEKERIMQKCSNAVNYDELIKEYFHKDGRRIPVSLRGWVTRDQNNQPMALMAIVRDISDRLKVEQALKESENRYRSIVETAEEGICLIDADYRVVFANRRLAAMVGYSDEAIIGRIIFSFLDEEGRALAQSIIEQRPQGRVQLDFRLPHQNGSDLWVIVSTNISRDGQGNFTGALVMLTDITQRKRMEEMLRESEERFRSIYAQSPIGIEIYDPDGDLIDANQACLDIFGHHNIDEMQGLNLFAEVPPAIKETLIKGEALSFETKYVFDPVKRRTFKSGTCYLDCVITPLKTASNTLDGYLVQIQDITEGKQFEEELLLASQVFANVSGGLMVTDAYGAIRSVNPAFTRITGYSQNEAIGKFAQQLGWQYVPPDFSREILTSIQKRGSWHGQIWSRKRSGEPYIQGLTISAIKNDKDQIIFCIFSFNDITDNEKLREEKEQLAAQTAKLQRLASLNTFSTGMVHELYQPLNAIKIIADGILYWHNEGRPFEMEAIINNLKKISGNVKRIDDIVQSMRSFASLSRLEKPVPCNLNGIIIKALDLIGPRFSGFVVNKDLSDKLPAVMGNARVYEEVVLNLIKNAIQAFNGVEREKKEISLRSYIWEGRVIMEISDNATGIAQDIAERILEPFFTTKKQGEGIGLGLSIVQSIIIGLNGDLRVFNNCQGGATFVVDLPGYVE